MISNVVAEVAHSAVFTRVGPFTLLLLGALVTTAVGTTKTIYAVVPDGAPAFVMQCDAGTYISSVTFASWGTPIGQSPPFQVSSSCAYKNSVAVVQSSCQYQTGCTLQATSAFFGNDPCPGTAKSLAVEMTCSITPPQTSCTGGVRVDGRCGSAAFGWANCAFGQCCSPTNWYLQA